MNKLKMPTNRNFGIVFFIVFLLIGLFPLIQNKEPRVWSLVISIIFLILGILNSKILTPLNKFWMKFGLFLGNLISPIVMGIIYFGVITPTGIIMRILQKDILSLKKNNKKTYWLERDNVNNNMRNQF